MDSGGGAFVSVLLKGKNHVWRWEGPGRNVLVRGGWLPDLGDRVVLVPRYVRGNL